MGLLGLYLYLVVEPMTLLFVAKTAQAYWLHAHSSQSTIAALPFQSHFSITSFLTILSIFPSIFSTSQFTLIFVSEATAPLLIVPLVDFISPMLLF